jgi:hypothetical protein
VWGKYEAERFGWMPRNGNKPTPKDLIAELAAREDGVVHVQSHISGIAGSSSLQPRLLRGESQFHHHCSRAQSPLLASVCVPGAL